MNPDEILTISDFISMKKISQYAFEFEKDIETWRLEEIIYLEKRIGRKFLDLKTDERTLFRGALVDLIFLRWIWPFNDKKREEIVDRIESLELNDIIGGGVDDIIYCG